MKNASLRLLSALAVVDSNVWISAFIFKGLPLQAVQEAFVRSSLVACAEIRMEVQKVLFEKFKVSYRDSSAWLDQYLQSSPQVILTGNLRNICRDRKDDMVVECAVVAKAQLIISGDKDLLSMGSYGDIQILSPRGFLDLPQTAI